MTHAPRPCLFLLLSLAALPAGLACGDAGPEGLLGADDQLESVEVGTTLAQEEPTDLSLSGPLAVSGADADWVLSITDETLAQAVDVVVHNPGRSDLSLLSGVQVQAELHGDWFAEHYSLVLRDASGPAFVLDMGLHQAESDALFGEGFARPGEVLGSDEDETWATEYTSLLFQTDAGEVELLPGEVEVLQIGGAAWRVVAIAAWTREPQPGASLPGCPVAEELLSYEMLRVAVEEEASLLTRPEGLAPATAGCD